MRKLRSRPPGEPQRTLGVEKFISSAATETRQAPAGRADITKVFNLRLPEPAFLKLKYIAEHSPHSMQKFCLDVLLSAIDVKVDELIKEHRPRR